jgi:serine/threonine-protein kinase
MGRGEEARLNWSHAIKTTNAGFSAWIGYPELCLFLGDEKEYRDARKAMLEQFGARKDLAVIEPLVRACLLRPSSTRDDEVWAEATTLAAQTMTAKSDSGSAQRQFAQFLMGLVKYRAGDFDAAKQLMNPDFIKVMDPCPRIVLAMALKGEGSDSEARQVLAKAIGKFDWRPAKADSLNVWINHIFRREAEEQIVPYLPELLNGSRQPQDNDERIIMLASLQFQKEDRKCAQVFSDALTNEAHLIEIRAMNPGFVAACAACALSSSVPKDDAGGIANDDSVKWKAAAYRWLADELKIKMRQNHQDIKSRYWMQNELLLWRQDPELTPLRDPIVMQSLPEAQRDECAAFWKAVDDAITRLQSTGPTSSIKPN